MRLYRHEGVMETLDQKIDAVLIELGTLHHKLDALISCLVEEGEEQDGDEYGAERDGTQTL